MTMTSPATEESDVRSFWETVELWPTRFERWCADRWPYLILVPYLLLAIYGFAFVVLERRIPSDLSGSYEVSSLGIALLVSGAFFKSWEPKFRDALGSLYARGSVEDTPPAHYLEFSKEHASWFSSPWRLLPILSCVAFTFAVNWIVGIEILSGSTFKAPRSYLVLFGATMTVTLCAWSYAVGAVAWCFCVAARTLWSLSGRGVRLRVFFGHPDNCGGLRPLGDASLGMTYPLLVGCVLLATWALPGVFPFGLSSSPNEFVQHYVRLFVPATRVALVAVIGLTAALFFGPLWKIHCRMAAVHGEYENEYGRRLDQLLRSSSVTVLNASDSDVKQAAERLSVLQSLSPESLRLSDWPIDGRMVAKYVVTPIATLITSFGKDIVGLLK